MSSSFTPNDNGISLSQKVSPAIAIAVLGAVLFTGGVISAVVSRRLYRSPIHNDEVLAALDLLPQELQRTWYTNLKLKTPPILWDLTTITLKSATDMCTGWENIMPVSAKIIPSSCSKSIVTSDTTFVHTSSLPSFIFHIPRPYLHSHTDMGPHPNTIRVTSTPIPLPTPSSRDIPTESSKLIRVAVVIAMPRPPLDYHLHRCSEDGVVNGNEPDYAFGSATLPIPNAAAVTELSETPPNDDLEEDSDSSDEGHAEHHRRTLQMLVAFTSEYPPLI